MNIQSAIEKLNIGTADKQKLKEEVELLSKQRREMEEKLKSLDENLEEEKDKERQLKKEITELDMQIHNKKVQRDHSNSVDVGDNERVAWLKEEINKKQLEVSAA